MKSGNAKVFKNKTQTNRTNSVESDDAFKKSQNIAEKTLLKSTVGRKLRIRN